jgi:cytochrome c-type biogenesis protein CcmH
MVPLRVALPLVFLLGVVVLPAAAVSYQFSSPEEEDRFHSLSQELRCLVCQNQSLADSNAELASDLRDEVYTMLKSGQSDAQIINFLVTRYGDFVLYRPPVKQSTYLLWFGPFVFLALAAFFVLRLVRRRGKETGVATSDADRHRVAEILRGEGKPGNGERR